LLVDLERLAHALLVLRIQSLVEKLPHKSHLQARERLLEGGDVVRDRCVDAGGIVGIESGHLAQQQRGVCGARAQHPALIETRGERDHAVARHAPVGGFDPGDAAQRRGLADRATGVGRGCSRDQARGDRGGGAARGAAGHELRVPGLRTGP